MALPSLVFTNVATCFGRSQDFMLLGTIVLTSLIYILAGYLLAKVWCAVFKVGKHEENAVTCALMFGNTGSFAIGIVVSLVEEIVHPHLVEHVKQMLIVSFVGGRHLCKFVRSICL